VPAGPGVAALRFVWVAPPPVGDPLIVDVEGRVADPAGTAPDVWVPEPPATGLKRLPLVGVADPPDAGLTALPLVGVDAPPDAAPAVWVADPPAARPAVLVAEPAGAAPGACATPPDAGGPAATTPVGVVVPFGGPLGGL